MACGFWYPVLWIFHRMGDLQKHWFNTTMVQFRMIWGISILGNLHIGNLHVWISGCVIFVAFVKNCNFHVSTFYLCIVCRVDCILTASLLSSIDEASLFGGSFPNSGWSCVHMCQKLFPHSRILTHNLYCIIGYIRNI